MIAGWPAGISFIDHPGSYGETGPQGNLIRTPMDKGKPKSRRRFTGVSRTVSGETDIMSSADVAVFETWFNDTLDGGALPFTANNPRTGVSETYQFKETTYDIIHVHTGRARLKMSLEQVGY